MTSPNLMLAQLFIPRARVYSVTDKIPIHLQLSGPPHSLQHFVVPPSHSGAIIRVVLQQELTVETRGHKASRNIVLAEGRLSEIPPLICSPCEYRDSIHLNWEGELRCSSDTSVGGFCAGDVAVKVSSPLEGLFNCALTHDIDRLGLRCSRHKAP